jgi:hypothetical protein
MGPTRNDSLTSLMLAAAHHKAQCQHGGNIRLLLLPSNSCAAVSSSCCGPCTGYRHLCFGMPWQHTTQSNAHHHTHWQCRCSNPDSSKPRIAWLRLYSAVQNSVLTNSNTQPGGSSRQLIYTPANARACKKAFSNTRYAMYALMQRVVVKNNHL